MSAGGVQLLQKRRKVTQALGPCSVLEGLVLGEDVDESVSRVVAVTAEQVPSAVTQRRQHLPDLGVGTELRHSAWAVAKAAPQGDLGLPAAAVARPS